MKTLKYSIGILWCVITLFACKDKFDESYMANIPVYLSYENLRLGVKSKNVQPIKSPGKIYFKDNYIFINEELKGVHIIDNSNPKQPENIGFISIPGNVDIAIKNNVLYADSYVDLVVVDIADIQNPKEIGRTKYIFNYMLPDYDRNYPLGNVDREKGVVVSWKKERVYNELKPINYPIYDLNKDSFIGTESTGNSGSSASSFGVGGSMARFGLYQQYLYTTERNKLTTLDISVEGKPHKIGQVFLRGNAETLFIHDNHLFFGTQRGMLVYSLESPIIPKYKAYLQHIMSCDPVVVDKNYAYVTLRGGTRCRTSVNQLDIIQLENNYSSLKLIASYPMDNPYGLGVDDDILFVCDGKSGLKIYNVADKKAVANNLIATFSDIDAYDVIPLGKYLFLIGKDGFYQYDYSNLNNITLVSKIGVVKSE